MEEANKPYYSKWMKNGSPRPKYETREHLSAESAFIKDIFKTKLFGNSAKKLDWKKYNIDYAFFNNDPYVIKPATYHGGKLSCFMELKCRNITSTAWPTYMISLRKFKTGIEWAEFCNVPFYLAVRFTDCDMITKARMGEDIFIGWGGRTDRNDPNDEEPVVFVPISLFEPLDYGQVESSPIF